MSTGEVPYNTNKRTDDRDVLMSGDMSWAIPLPMGFAVRRRSAPPSSCTIRLTYGHQHRGGGPALEVEPGLRVQRTEYLEHRLRSAREDLGPIGDPGLHGGSNDATNAPGPG